MRGKVIIKEYSREQTDDEKKKLKTVDDAKRGRYKCNKKQGWKWSSWKVNSSVRDLSPRRQNSVRW